MTMVHVTLPDGTINEYAAGVTAGEVVVDALGKKHGCLAARINDVKKDLSTPINDAPASLASLARPSLPLKPNRPPSPASGLTTIPIRMYLPASDFISSIALDLVESIHRCFDVIAINGESWSSDRHLTKLISMRS